MSIETAIERIADKISDSYDAVERKGGTIPVEKKIKNLPDAIDSIPVGSGSGDCDYSWWSPRMTSNTTFATPTLAHPNLQPKTATPTKSSQAVLPDDAHDGLSIVTVEKIPDIYQDTSDATASASDILEGKTAYVNGNKVIGTASVNPTIPETYEWWSPKMTSESTPSPYSVDAMISGAVESHPGWHAFDGSADTYWEHNTNGFVTLIFPEVTKIAGVQIIPSSKANASTYPKKIVVLGANNTLAIGQYEEIFTNDWTAESDTDRASMREYTFDPVGYTHFMIMVSDGESGTGTGKVYSIGDIRFKKLVDPASVTPKYQEKTVTPAVSVKTVVADADYDALSKVTVEKIPNQYKDTSDATASASDILAGKTAYVNGEKVTGTASGGSGSAPKLQEKTVIPTAFPQTVTPDVTYDGLSKVNVTAIPEEPQNTQYRWWSPVMSSNTFPSPYALFGDSLTTDSYKAFDNNTNTVVSLQPPTSDSNSIPELGFDFGTPAKISGIKIAGSNTNIETVKVLGNNSGTDNDFVEIASETVFSDLESNGLATITFDPVAYRYFKFLFIEHEVKSERKVSIGDITFYREFIISNVNLQAKTVTPTTSDQKIVADSAYDGLSEVTVKAIPDTIGYKWWSPKMTSNTTPVPYEISSFGLGSNSYKLVDNNMSTYLGVATSSTSLVGGTNTIFNFGKATSLRGIRIYPSGSDLGRIVKKVTISGRNDASGLWTKIFEGTVSGQQPTTFDVIEFVFDSTESYKYYEISVDEVWDGGNVANIAEIEFYILPSNDISLQTKTATPTTSSQTITPDAGYDALSKVTIDAIPSAYKDTSDGTATASDIKSGKTAYVNGSKVTGNLSTVTAATPSITVSSSGLITASTSQDAGIVSSSTKSATKQLTTQAAQTITPGTSSKTIASGTYLTGTQTISGDTNLKAANIKSGVSIFGISGSYTGSSPTLQAKTASPTTSQQIITPDSGYDGLSKVTIAKASLTTKTVTPSASSQTVTPTSSYLGFSSVTVNAIPDSLKAGVTTLTLKCTKVQGVAQATIKGILYMPSTGGLKQFTPSAYGESTNTLNLITGSPLFFLPVSYNGSSSVNRIYYRDIPNGLSVRTIYGESTDETFTSASSSTNYYYIGSPGIIWIYPTDGAVGKDYSLTIEINTFST